MDNKIALLIDCDNISFKLIDSVIQELEQYGEIIIKRAYGNWRSDSLKNWLIKLPELSIKPIHQIDYTKGKNASDMAIVIDAMDMMHLKKVNAFAIVSSDSDFTPLTMKLQEEGFKVYGFGTKQTPASLKNSCSVFTDIQSLVNNTKETEDKKAGLLNKTQLREQISKVFAQQSPNNEWVTMEKINQLMKENGIDFKNYGFKQLKVFIDDLNLFQIRINDKNQGFVQLIQNKYEPGVSIESEVLANNPLLKTILLDAYNTLNINKHGVQISTYCNYLFHQHNMTHKTYGCSTFKEFLVDTQLFDFTTKDSQYYITAKK